MIVNTAIDMYNLTLELLNQGKTSSVTPDEWMYFVNSVMLQRVSELYEEYQKSQTNIDKLSPLIQPPVIIPNTGAAVAGQEKFVLPYMTTPGSTTMYSYGYMRLLNVGFKLQYVNNPCFAGQSLDYILSKLMKDDSEYFYKNNPYKRPKNDRLYYQIRDNAIYLLTGTQTYGVDAKLTYLRYPRQIDLNQSPGVGDCELPIDVRNEICELTAKKIIELMESGRFRTIAQEIQGLKTN